MITGIYYIVSGVPFPAIRVKILSGDGSVGSSVLCQVFTDEGPNLLLGTVGPQTGHGENEGLFIPDL